MKKYNKILVLMLVVVFSLVLVCAGCSQGDTDTTAKGDKKITVTDGLGREVVLDKAAEKVVSPYGIAVQMMFTLGAQDSLAGVGSPMLKNPFFKAIKPDIVDLPVVGTPQEFNIEQCISLKPDLVLLPGRNKELVDNLEAKGINVFGVVAEDMDELKNSVLELGKALGKEEQAQEFVKYYDDTMKMVNDKTAGIDDKDKPTVYLVGPMGVLSTCSQDMYQNYLIELAGGKNAAAELKGGWVDVSPEQVINWNPDIMVAVQYTTGVTIEDILKDKRWQGIDAVKNKEVFWFPSILNPWDYPSPEAALGIQWLAQKLHPEQFKDLDMVKEADDFYKKFYGKTFTELGGDLTSQEKY
ncbi:MAG TPA: ABC transporter substrate-binding protein [Syntrophomonadaceae bacterium]|nr:ABC transporter substrate-binding protein [Syntrophomonadaceae bacterium]